MINLSYVSAFHACLLSSFVLAWTPSTPSRPCRPQSSSLEAKRGFASAGSPRSKKSKQRYTAYSLPETESNSIEDFLHPRLQDPEVLNDIGRRIRDGQVVVLRHAFNDELAEAMHQQLDWTENWDRNEDYFDDGYHYRHFNIYDQQNFPPLFTAVNRMFESNATKEFLTEVTGRDCTGSAHFVTTVSPQATEKRLAYNGWWHSSWTPTSADPVEDMLASPEERMRLTHAQIMALQDMLDDPWAPRIQPPERLEKIEGIRRKVMDELYPQSLSSPID